MIRSFFAIDLPQELQQSMNSIIEQLHTHNLAIQWVKQHNLHITLQFMKNIQQHDIPVLIKNIRHALQDIPPFEIELDHLELFPEVAHPRLMSIALTSDIMLTEIAMRLGQTILTTGYPIETRPFRAHLTLGRLKELPPKDFSCMHINLPANKKFLVKEILFYQSHRSHEGASYTLIARIALTNSSSEAK